MAYFQIAVPLTPARPPALVVGRQTRHRSRLVDKRLSKSGLRPRYRPDPLLLHVGSAVGNNLPAGHRYRMSSARAGHRAAASQALRRFDPCLVEDGVAERLYRLVRPCAASHARAIRSQLSQPTGEYRAER